MDRKVYMCRLTAENRKKLSPKAILLLRYRLECNLLVKVFFSVGMLFCVVTDVFAQKQSVKSNTDSLRPKVDFANPISKNPFHNYLIEAMKKANKVEEVELAVPAPNLTVQGLIWGGRLHMAIIENRVLKVGDVISGYTIDKIDKNGVIVAANGKLFKLGTPSLSPVNNVAKIQEGGKDAK